MQSHKSPTELVAALQEWQAVTGHSYKEIARKAKVDLSTVYRVLSEEASPEKAGSGIKKLCKIAKISLYTSAPPGQLPKTLTDALLTVWDGSTGHAKRLATAIVAIGNLERSQLSSRREKQ